MLDADPRHRLLAILAADAVGYSRLMGIDDRATLHALEAARVVFRSQTTARGGRVIDTAGDSVLAVFDSATGAAQAAIAVQQQLTDELQHGALTERLQFRIGVHLGDVIECADGTVYGEGVNIAARLQALAEPGGIAVSGSIQSALRGRSGAFFSELGDHQLKNIADPVRAYRLSGVDLSAHLGATPAAPSLQTTALPTDAGPLSIVVLPLANLTGSPEQSYVADGISASITADLSRIRDVFVVSSSTAMAYRDKALTVQQVGRELGVRFVLQGNVQRREASIRVNVQLADAGNNSQLWSETFDGDATDLFALQDEVTTRIGNSLGRELVIRAARESERQRTTPTVANLLLKARALNLQPQSFAILEQMEGHCRAALRQDPSNVESTAILAASLAQQVVNFPKEFDPSLRQTKTDESHALAINGPIYRQ